MDRVFETPDNITKCILPYNDITKNFFYDDRIIISVDLIQPLAWRVSKVEPFAHRGNILYTLKQDVFDEHHDYVERNSDGEIIGMWCDYFKDSNIPGVTVEDPEVLPQETYGNYAEITYGGAKPLIKINGSYRTVSVAYYNSNELIKDQTPGDWSFFIGDIDASDLIKVSPTDEENTIKIKFVGGEEYIDNILTVKNTRDEIVAELRLDITAI